MNVIDSTPGAVDRTGKREADASHEVAAQFAAELTRIAFAPLAKTLGFYGDAALAAAATSIARHETGGLTDELARIVRDAR